MRTSLILLTSLLFLSENVIAQEFEWIRQFGDTAAFERADAVAVDANSVYTAGPTTGTFPGETQVGFFDGFLRKYDTDGNELWTRQFGLVVPTNRPSPQGIAVDATGVYVAGFSFDFFALPQFFGFVRKYDPDGNEVWTRLVSAINHFNQIRAISADASGVYVAGTRSDLSVDNAAFVTKYDAAGNELWTRLIDSTNTDIADAVCVDGNGVYVAGRAAAPLPGQTHVSGFDPFVRKYDLDGNEVWTRQFGTTCHFESAEAVSVHGSSVYVVGRTCEPLPGQTRSGGIDVFVRKYDIDGNENWTRQFKITPDFSQSVGASADATGVYLAGRTSISLPGQTNAGADDAFVRKYDIDGDEVWTRQFGSPKTDRATSVAVEVGKIYVAGITLGVLPGQTTTNTFADAFVVKLFQVSIDLLNIIVQLQTIADAEGCPATCTPLGAKVQDALAKAQTALNEHTKTPPCNQAAVGAMEGAVGDLCAAVVDVGLDPVQGTQLMDGLAGLARALAAEAIRKAIAAGANGTEIAAAEASLAVGDALRVLGVSGVCLAFKDAVNQYKNALVIAEGALP